MRNEGRGTDPMDAKTTFLAAVSSRSSLPGINDINLASAACALLRAEKEAPGSEETRLMRAMFDSLGRPDVYDRVKAVVDGTQP